MKEPLILLTVIFENVLRDEIEKVFAKSGASGFSITRVDGQGSRGVRAAEFEGPNLKIEAVVSAELSDSILKVIEENYFEDYAVIAWESNVNVLRGSKFVPPAKA